MTSFYRANLKESVAGRSGDDNTARKPLVSVIVPVLNEKESLPLFYMELCRVTESLADTYEFEFLFTDNHSSDGTFEMLQRLAERDSRIKAIRFSRDFGYQRSIHAGFMRCSGDAAIQIDCDLQDPPDMMRDFLKRWTEGYQVVFGIRTSRDESPIISRIRSIFYRFLNFISDDVLPLDAGDFRLLDRAVVDEIKKDRDVDPYLRGSIALMGFEQVGIEYERQARAAGRSKFGLVNMLRLSMDGILNHSTVPLRVSLFFSFLILVSGGIGILFYGAGRLLFFHKWPRGFATLTVLQLMAISLNGLFMGIQGEYISRIYRQVKGKPRIIVEKTIP